MSKLRHVTYNLLDYGEPLTADPDHNRMELVLRTIERTCGDVFSVEEIYGPSAESRTATFVALAAVLGFACHATNEHGDTGPVFDPGRGARGVGVMWRPDRITPVPNTRRYFDRQPLTVGMALVKLRVDGRVMVTVASTHAPPRFPRQREDEGVFVGSEIFRAGQHGIAGADWNNVFASRDQTGNYYDPDPYASVPWHPRHIGKAIPNPATGCGIARRDAMHQVEHAGLLDPAAFLNAPRFRTVGHWKQSAINKRIDGPIVTLSVAQAATSIQALDQALTHQASDHLPMMLDIDVNALANA